MDSEWSMDFAFPLLSLLKSNGSEDAAYNKATQICFHNKMLAKCVQRCDPSTEKQIIEYGLEPWESVCENLRTLKLQFRCWKYHIEALSLSCYMEGHKLRNSMKLLAEDSVLPNVDRVCADMNVLSQCVLEEYGRACGMATVKLLSNLFRSSQHSVTQMLTMKWPKLPESCNKSVNFEAVTAEFRSSSLRAPLNQSLTLIMLGVWSLSRNLLP